MTAMNYAELTEAFLERGDAIERVWVLVGEWANEDPSLDKWAATRSRDGDDSLTEALRNSRAYATALAAALDGPS